MVNMLKITTAIMVLIAIISIAILGKNASKILVLRAAKMKLTEGWWMQAITGALTFGMAITFYLKNEPTVTPLMWAGAAMFAAGGIVQIIAKKDLFDDSGFEERLSSGFEAAQTGIYSHIRYPSQTAAILALTGICLLTGSHWSLALFAALFIPSTIYRISEEEEKLSEKFGNRWNSYQEDTKKIMPWIY